MKARLLLLLLALGTCATAQSVLIRVLQGDSLAQVANGGSVTVNAAGVGQPQTFTVDITYLGTTTLVFSQSPQILGSQSFAIISPPAAGTVLGPNQSVTMQVQYTPASGSSAQAELDYAAMEQATPSSIPRMIVLGFNGTAPDFRLNYQFSLDSNVVSLPAGGTLTFLDTPISSTTSATMVLSNSGSGSGQVVSVATTGDAFGLVSAPLLPGVVASGGTLQFQVRYVPRQVGTDTGTLTITLAGGTTYSVRLTGRAIASYLTYDILPPSGATVSVLPNGTITVPGAAVGDKSTVFVRMKNTSAFDIQVSAIAVSGTSFQLTDVPFAPFSLAPNQVQLITLVFQPTAAGQQTGKLRIGADSFDLVGNGIGPSLTYSYVSPAGTTTVQSLGAVVFPSAQVGGTSSVDFTIKNVGSAQAPIISIGVVSDGKVVFTPVGVPTLPTAIAPNSSMTFTVKFAPLTLGLASASLRINNDAFTLTGLAVSPTPLPGYTISGPATVQPLDQPAISLTLASAYPVNLTGTVTLSTEPDGFVGDPAVLFILGTKTATFTIPAGSTSAVFSNGSTNLRLQVGSVSGGIVVTPTFATEGGLDLTPTSPTRLRMTMAGAAPKIYTVSVISRTSTGFVLEIVGLTDTRSLTKLNVSFKGKSGYNFSAGDYSQDLTGASLSWFNSQSSVVYGGQFVLQIPFTLTASDGSTSPVSALDSVAVMIANSIGTSSTSSVVF